MRKDHHISTTTSSNRPKKPILGTTPHYCLLNSLAIIRVSGANAAEFLQGQLTCDVRTVTESQPSLGALCDQKGKVISTFRLICFNDEYFLILFNNESKPTYKRLKQFAVFSKVTISTEHPFITHIGIIGDFKPLKRTENTITIHIPGSIQRYEILSTQPSITQEISAQPGLTQTPLSVWQSLDILNKLPSITAAIANRFTPHMLELTQLDAVSFKKGCYVGQEIIARTEHLGNPKRGLFIAKSHCSRPPKPGAELYLNDKSIGNIISLVQENEDDYLLLILLPKYINGKIYYHDDLSQKWEIKYNNG